MALKYTEEQLNNSNKTLIKVVFDTHANICLLSTFSVSIKSTFYDC